jgi:hypothetical protein
MQKEFDVIVFATGYKSIANEWLKVYVIINIKGGQIDHLPTIYILQFIFIQYCSFYSLDF